MSLGGKILFLLFTSSSFYKQYALVYLYLSLEVTKFPVVQNKTREDLQVFKEKILKEMEEHNKKKIEKVLQTPFIIWL